MYLCNVQGAQKHAAIRFTQCWKNTTLRLQVQNQIYLKH